MHLAYVDESGDSGLTGSLTYSLACVLIHGQEWPDAFDNMLLYRRFLRDRFGVPVRAEIKANHLLRNGGAFRNLGLSEQARYAIYRGHLRLQQKLAFQCFAVVIRKQRLQQRNPGSDPREFAWRFLLQRLERFTTRGTTEVVIVHDEGESAFVRRATRKARRYSTVGAHFTTGSLNRPARRLLEDPVSKKSHESYFLQLADLDAYAAFRCCVPPPQRAVQIVPTGMWNELGDARFTAVSSLVGGPMGIVVWP
jgi:hypothetical protein